MKPDFEEDLKELIKKAYISYRLQISIDREFHDILLDYFTILKKLIPPIPRYVYASPPLLEKLLTHPKRKEIEEIAIRLAYGMDVNLFQSKKLFQTNFHDHLVYEWDIYHLHLSLEKDPKSIFYKKTDLMLFAYIVDEKAILLDTEKHLEGVFGDVRWLEILHDYYPKDIALYRDDTIKRANPVFNAKDRQIMWDKGYSFPMTMVRDVCYLSKGVGRSTSGHSILVNKDIGEVIRWLDYADDIFGTKGEIICRSFGIPVDNHHFKLRFNGKKMEIYDTVSDICLLIYPNRFGITHSLPNI